MSQSKFKLRTSERALGESYKYFVRIWFGLRSQKLAIIKEGASYWLGNNEKIRSQSNFKLTFSKISLDIIRGF